MFSKIKGWAIGLGAAFITGIIVVTQIFSAGRKQAEQESIVRAGKEKDAFADAIKSSDDSLYEHRANGVPIDQDPNNRANRRRGQG